MGKQNEYFTFLLTIDTNSQYHWLQPSIIPILYIHSLKKKQQKRTGHLTVRDSILHAEDGVQVRPQASTYLGFTPTAPPPPGSPCPDRVSQ